MRSRVAKISYTVAVLVAASYALVTLHGGVPVLIQKQKDIRTLEKENADLHRDIEFRRARIQRLRGDESAQELEIRQRLKLVRPGEKVFILQEPADSEKPRTPAVILRAHPAHCDLHATGVVLRLCTATAGAIRFHRGDRNLGAAEPGRAGSVGDRAAPPGRHAAPEQLDGRVAPRFIDRSGRACAQRRAIRRLDPRSHLRADARAVERHPHQRRAIRTSQHGPADPAGRDCARRSAARRGIDHVRVGRGGRGHQRDHRSAGVIRISSAHVGWKFRRQPGARLSVAGWLRTGRADYFFARFLERIPARPGLPQPGDRFGNALALSAGRKRCDAGLR